MHLLLGISILLLLPFIHARDNVTRSTKKGLVIPSWPRHMCGDFEAFNTVSWWYNYHTYPDPQDISPWWCTCMDGKSPQDRSKCLPADPEVIFIPQVFGIPGMGQRPDDHDPPVDAEHQTILAYNEPNHCDQSCIPPEVAAEAYAQLTQLYPDKILVGPATAGPDTDWMDPFMAACDLLGCRIDYIGMHDYSGSADHVITRINNFSKRYGKKVWFTEFAVNNEHNEEKIISFIQDLLPQLEWSDHVYRYSWFISRYYPEYNDSGNWWIDPINSLLEQDSPQLSAVGRAYNNPWHLEEYKPKQLE